MGRRADGCGEAAANADHQGDEEGEWLIAQFFGSLVHDREEHGTSSGIRDELGDKGSDETDGSHHHDRVSAADVEDAIGEPFGEARLLDGKAENGTTGKDHENLPIDGSHGLLYVATTTDKHGGGSQEGTLQQRYDTACREHHHSNHNSRRHERTISDVGHFFRIEKVKIVLQYGSVDVDFLRTYQQQRVACLPAVPRFVVPL